MTNFEEGVPSVCEGCLGLAQLDYVGLEGTQFSWLGLPTPFIALGVWLMADSMCIVPALFCADCLVRYAV